MEEGREEIGRVSGRISFPPSSQMPSVLYTFLPPSLLCSVPWEVYKVGGQRRVVIREIPTPGPVQGGRKGGGEGGRLSNNNNQLTSTSKQDPGAYTHQVPSLPPSLPYTLVVVRQDPIESFEIASRHRPPCLPRFLALSWPYSQLRLVVVVFVPVALKEGGRGGGREGGGKGRGES